MSSQIYFPEIESVLKEQAKIKKIKASVGAIILTKINNEYGIILAKQNKKGKGEKSIWHNMYGSFSGSIEQKDSENLVEKDDVEHTLFSQILTTAFVREITEESNGLLTNENIYNWISNPATKLVLNFNFSNSLNKLKDLEEKKANSDDIENAKINLNSQFMAISFLVYLESGESFIKKFNDNASKNDEILELKFFSMRVLLKALKSHEEIVKLPDKKISKDSSIEEKNIANVFLFFQRIILKWILKI